MSQAPTYTAYQTISATISAAPSPIIIIEAVDNITFPKVYFLYVGVPAAVIVLLTICYVNRLYAKYVRLKKMSAVAAISVTNASHLKSLSAVV